MSPISREREYARRRYEKWQAKLAVKIAKRRQRRRVVLISAAVVTVVLAVTGVVFFVGGLGSGTDTTASATPTTSSSATSASAAASAPPGPNPCPTPTVKPPATPQKFSAAPPPSLAEGKNWTFAISTSCGDIVATLDGAKAPKATANTIFLSGKKFWDGSPCHRLGSEGLYMLQCGDPTGSGSGGPGYQFGPVENAPAGGLYKAGTIAMARTSDPGSQGSQFFLVFKDTQLSGDYTVFGKITKGMDVIVKVAEGGIPNPSSDGSGAPGRPISIVRTTVTPG